MAFHLHWFRESRKVSKDRCAALVIGSEKGTQEQIENRQMLEQIATVIDVTDTERACKRLSEVASLNGHS